MELIEDLPIREAAKILRRSSPSIRSMLHRWGLGARQNREWFTVSLLAQALHISRPEVQKWIDRGWLNVALCRFDPEDYRRRGLLPVLDALQVFPGPDAKTYAFWQLATQRNLYRIGLP